MKLLFVIQSVVLTGWVVAFSAAADSPARELLEAREFESAIERAESVIARYDTPYERYSDELVEPLLVVGEAHLALQRPVDAFQVFERAQAIQRVNHGLHAVEQIDALRWQARALVAIDDYRGANNRLEAAYVIAHEQYPRDSAEALTAAVELADWYADHFHIYFARALYDRAYKIAASIDAPVGDLVRILRQIAWTYRTEYFPTRGPGKFRPTTACCGGHSTSIRFGRLTAANRRTAERALVTAANLLTGGEIEAPERKRLSADVLLELGDWYMLRDRKERARETYARVAEMLDDAEREALFATPKVLYRPHPGNPQKPAAKHDPDPQVGFVQIAVRVNSSGQVRAGPKVERSLPEDLLAIKYLRQARFAKFRPPFVDGELRNDGEAMVLYAFRYHPKL